jgi:hypothetical protein
MPIIAALPYIGSAGLAALRFAPSLVRAGSRLIKPRATTGIRQTGTAVVPYTGGGLPAVVGGGARVGSGSVPSAGGRAAAAGGSSIFRSPSMFTAGAAVTSLPFMLTEPTPLLSSAEESASGGGITEEQRKRDSEDEQTGVPRKDKDDETKKTVEDINKGDLDDYISKNIGLFEKFLGDRKGETKAAGFQALTEFGLNLATARGGNLIDKIARSAKDPLQTFAAIGKAARDRADKIKMAAIETGIQQREAALDRAEKDKPDDIQTLEYFMSIPGLRDKPIEELIRLSKSKATMSDDDFRKELILAFAPNIDRIGGPEAVEKLVSSIMALGTGTGGGTGGGLSMQEQVDLAKEKGASNDQIREQLIALGEDPADYGF